MRIDIKNRSKNAEERIALYRHLIALNPKDAELHFDLGRLFESLDLRQEALREWRKVIQIDANNLPARRAIQRLLQDGNSEGDRLARI